MAEYKRKPPVGELCEALREKHGNISSVARAYGVTRTSVYHWIADSAKAQNVLSESREVMIDNAESVLYRKVLDGSTPELIFFLKTQAKHRGYIERTEVDKRTNVSDLTTEELQAIVRDEGGG